MKPRLFIAALAALAAAALPLAPSFAQYRSEGIRSDGPDRRDWTDTAERTPEGGFRMGNPQARVKVIEYLSLTCPHCAQFAHEGGQRLFQHYVRSGRVSVEYRNFYLNGVDIAAALLSRCARPREYFSMTHALLGSQPQWMGRINAITPAQRAELAGLAPIEVAQRLISMLGLDAIGARHGITPAIRQSCLTQANLDQLERMNAASTAAGVTGTPAFVINGRLAGHIHDWAALEPLLRGN